MRSVRLRLLRRSSPLRPVAVVAALSGLISLISAHSAHATAFPNLTCSDLPITDTLEQGGNNNTNLTSFSLQPGETLLFTTSNLVDNSPSSGDPKWNLGKSGGGPPVDLVGTSSTFVQVSSQPTASFQNTTGATINASFKAQIDTGMPKDPKGASFDLTISCQPASPGKITIKKTTDTGDGTFGFSGTGPSPFSTSILTSSGTGSSGPFTTNPGSYAITETPDANYTLTNIVCTGATGSPAPSVDLGANKVTLTVASGDDVTCTFTNTKKQAGKGTIIIQKTAVNGDGATDFHFSGSLGPFTLPPPPPTGRSASPSLTLTPARTTFRRRRSRVGRPPCRATIMTRRRARTPLTLSSVPRP